MTTNVLLISTNTPSHTNAKKLARQAVERHLAASANIQSVETVYVWKGKIHESTEWQVIFKTVSVCRNDLFELIRELHGYEVPAFEVVRLEGVSQAYQEWIVDNCRGAGIDC